MPEEKRQSRGLYERVWPRYAVNRQGILTAVSLDLSRPKTHTCKMIDVSQGGASFQVSTTLGLPEHYYLSIVGVASQIGCAEVYRNGNRIGVQFIREINEELLHMIVRSEYLTGGQIAKPKQPDRKYMVGVEKGGIGSAVR